MTLWCDRLFTAGILFLILATPFAFGTVQAWAYTAMEAIIFGLVIVWMAKLIVIRGQRSEVGDQWGGAGSTRNFGFRISDFEFFACAIPLTLFVALVLFQLVPLPPSLLRVISPQTFEVYKQSLPGWPERVPYAEVESREHGAGSGIEQGATSEEQGEDGKEQRAKSKDGQRENAINATNTTNSVNPKSEIPPPGSELQAPSSMLRAPSSQLPAAALFPETWLPLSISTGLTKIDFLKFAAFAALFFLVWRYPFEKPFDDFEIRNSKFEFFILSPEQRFLRSVVFTVLGTGLLVAAFGFVERFAWNGNILLFVAGYDLGAPAANTVARASGPFINPDHFANYLSLIFPLALGCALFRTFMVSKSQEYGLKIFCGFTTFLLFTGILLSLSRGGWISALLGVVILVWLASWGGARQRTKSKRQGAGSRERGSQRSDVRDQRSEVRGRRSASSSMLHAPSSKLARMACLSLVTVCILLIVSLFFAGSGGREQVDLRLSETIEQTDLGLGARVSVILKDTPSMIMDFPLFGVGLGAWPELFLRYRSGPWSTIFFREAHNDYLEVLVETGLIGFGLLAGFFFVAGKRLVRGVRKSSSNYLPLIAGILAALGGMALHAWLDFSLQIPANAFLFTVLLALGLRLAGSMEQGARSREAFRISDFEMRNEFSDSSREVDRVEWREAGNERTIRNSQSAIRNFATRYSPYAGAVVAVALGACALLQDQSSYPYNFKDMTSLAEAKELLLKHPTHSPYHMSVLRLAGNSAPLSWQLAYAKAALWNEPVNPYYRDFYAATLMAMGRTEAGLKEVARSVGESPSLSTHVYLNPETLPLLSEAEQAAVEEGFKQALSRSYPEALNGLAEFYAKLDRFSDQAALYEQAALKEQDNAKKTELLIKGGLAYLKAADKQGAGSKEQAADPEKIRNSKSEIRNAQPAPGDAKNPQSAIRNSKFETPASGSELPAPSSMLHAAAIRLFHAAIAINPADPKPYQQLVTTIYATKDDLAAAKEIIHNAIQNGAPPLPLYLSLAETAQKAGNREEIQAALESAKAEVEKLVKYGESPYTLYIELADGAHRAGDREQESAALLKALNFQPRAPETLMRLANVSLEKRNYDRAALYLNRIANINPDSADVYYRIAQIEEGRYRFADAGRAYARAIELAPQNDGYRQRYDAFKEKVERNRKVTDNKSP